MGEVRSTTISCVPWVYVDTGLLFKIQKPMRSIGGGDRGEWGGVGKDIQNIRNFQFCVSYPIGDHRLSRPVDQPQLTKRIFIR